MKNDSHLLVLAKYILPEEVFLYFEITKIEEQNFKELHIYLDESSIVPEGYSSYTLSSKGFHEEALIKDFPIRDRGVMLHVRRRRWLVEELNKVVSRDWNLVAEGTRYTQGFATFLKGIIGYLPNSEPIS